MPQQYIDSFFGWLLSDPAHYNQEIKKVASSRSHSDVRSVSLDAASVSKYRAFHSILSRAVCGDMAVVRLVTF